MVFSDSEKLGDELFRFDPANQRQLDIIVRLE